MAEEIKKLVLPWSGTATKLLHQLESTAAEQMRRDKSWPRSGKVLSNFLRRIAPNLRLVGIAVEFGKREPGTGNRIISIDSICHENMWDRPSQPSQNGDEMLSLNDHDGCDGQVPTLSGTPQVGQSVRVKRVIEGDL
jgi:hypothetical protein